jgi:Protein of unknown function (DUF3224)
MTSVFNVVCIALLFMAAATQVSAQTQSVKTGAATVTQTAQTAQTALTAKGNFEVKLAAQSISDVAANEKLGRMSIDKVFLGDMAGTSKGEMLSAMGDVKGSAGYVALERVTATLNGKRGSFVLQHSGTMNRGAPALVVSVVPDSGTDALAGISGTFKIIIEPGKHLYEFSYTLPPN